MQAWRQGAPHPALGVVLHQDMAIIEPVGWETALADADIVAVAVASQGLQPVLSVAARYVSPNVVWMLATKGWHAKTLGAPSEVATATLGPAASVVTLAGPGIAAEIVAGSPTALLCASRDADARRQVTRALGVANTAVALGLAARYSIDLPTARAVDLALHRQLTEEDGTEQMRRLFTTTMRSGAPQPDTLSGSDIRDGASGHEAAIPEPSTGR